MASGLAEAIRLLVEDKGIPEDLIKKTIEDFLLAAYKKTFGTEENAVIKFSEDGSEVSLFARKSIVDGVYDPVAEIELEDAIKLNEECEVGDELLIEINPMEFDRGAVQSAKQKARQNLRDIQKDTLYSEFKDKEGEMIIGYHQRERNGNIFVDLGKTEGLLPKRYQSPREMYRAGDRIRAFIHEVSKSPSGLQIILSRTHPEFVKKIFELEVPEIYDGTVEVFKIVREPGYRTKVAVYSSRVDIDPVGACVGLKGVRIQSIVRELEGEKIDILKFETDPRIFIKNALSPAQISQVIILDEGKKSALAVVPEDQLSLAIGKQGLNVRLANRLVDWNIDVKTESQFAEMDISKLSKQAMHDLFGEIEEEEIEKISELPGIDAKLVEVLEADGVEYIEDLVDRTDEQLLSLDGITTDDVATLRKIISDNLEIIDEDDQSGDEYEEEYSDDITEGETLITSQDDALDQNESDIELETEPKDEYYDDASNSYVEYEEDEETLLTELPDVPENLVQALSAHGVKTVIEVLSMEDEQLLGYEGVTLEDLQLMRKIISENVEIIEEEE
jgi:N utilization substance protein A